MRASRGACCRGPRRLCASAATYAGARCTAAARRAIDASDGRAQGALVGEVADAITQRFKATTPITIDVSTERRYVQPGCSRLLVRFRQDGVLLPGALSPRRQTIDFRLDYCRDGLPPKSRS